MTSNLYPLSFKPGIKRDGTLFQADYCTDGQWVRFQRGFIRKMGGMKGSANLGLTPISITNLTLIPLAGNANIGVYVAGRNNAGIPTIAYYEETQNYDRVAGPVDIYAAGNQPNLTWHSTVIIQNQNQKIIFMGCPDSDNINSNANAILMAFTLANAPLNFVQLPLFLSGLSGMLFSNPYLFVYGSNGLLQWSKPTDPLDFGGNDKRSISISNDKVIYGSEIRGGVNSPTLLFWTMTTVVRLINTGANALDFQRDVLSRKSSILSSRCVVEHKGIFYWIGSEGFYTFNGIEVDHDNPLSLNYFFNNIDMSRRQQVWGQRNERYKEIWWFYPEKANAPFRDNTIPVGENSRALIYNIRDNTWYDTAISRSAGIYSGDFGFMSSVGRFLTDPANVNTTIFRHEYETFSDNPNAIMEVAPAILNQPNPIPSYFVTPTISWSAFNPMKQLTGVNRWMSVESIEPDFTLLPVNTDLQVRIIGKQYAQSYRLISDPYNINPLLGAGDDPILAKIDTHFQARHISFRFDTTLNFEMGQTMLLLGIGDGQ